MSWRKTTATAVLALVVIFCMTGCPTKPPATPGAPWGPDSAWRGGIYVCSVATTVPKGSIRYVMNWTDTTDTGELAYGSGETAAVSHSWSDTGHFDVKAKAILDADPTKASDFSAAKSVRVLPNSPPVVDSVQHPPVGIKDAETPFIVFGHDPDGDSLQVVVKWDDGTKDTTTSYSLSPCMIPISHAFAKVETAKVVFRAQDWKGAKSRDTIIPIPVGTSGGMKWIWQSSTDQEAISSSVIVANDGTDEVVMGCCEGEQKFFSIKAGKGKDKKSASPKDATGSSFIGNPGLMNNGHIIVGGDDGFLYALSISSLHTDWTSTDTTGIGWGAPAFNGSDIYIGREDDTLSLYHIVDAGSQGTMAGVYQLNASVVDAPVVDASGNVIVCTDDSGYVIKFDKDLFPIWRTRLLSGAGEADGVIIGTDGTIYCGSDSTLLYAVDPDSGHVKWTTPLDAPGRRPVIGRDTLFVGTEAGTFYSINPTTGSINWQKTLSSGLGFLTAPIVAANGYVYAQNENDVLYALNQADGTVIWSCDCESYLSPTARSGSSHRPRKPGVAGLTDYKPNPSITSTGDIIVVGDLALYCVAGYTDGPLDPSAAWPKWQKNLSNTGSKTGR